MSCPPPPDHRLVVVIVVVVSGVVVVVVVVVIVGVGTDGSSLSRIHVAHICDLLVAVLVVEDCIEMHQGLLVALAQCYRRPLSTFTSTPSATAAWFS